MNTSLRDVEVSTELTIVIPAYNESARLPRTLRSLQEFLVRDGRRAEVIVVDDGSTDETSARVRGERAADTRIRLIRLPHNRGKGCAVRAGVAHATGTRILLADADGATPFEELRRLEAAMADQCAHVAIGSRALHARDTRVHARLYRRLAGRAFQFVVRVAAVPGIADTQCGFKLFERDAADALFTRGRIMGYCFDVEILYMARRQGYRIAEVPVNWTHQPGSKVGVLRDGVTMVRDVIRIRANGVRGLYDRPRIAVTDVNWAPRL